LGLGSAPGSDQEPGFVSSAALSGLCPFLCPPWAFRAFDCFDDRVRLRVNVTPCGGEVAVSRQITKGIRVPVCCPLRQARKTEGVQGEAQYLANLHAFGCCFFKLDFFDMPAPGRRRKDPFTFGHRAPHLHNPKHPLRSRESAVAIRAPGPYESQRRRPGNCLPSQSEALLRPKSAVNQNGDNIAQQIRIRLLRFLSPLSGPDAFERPPVSFAQPCPMAVAASRYFRSSSALKTRSRRFSPGSKRTRGSPSVVAPTEPCRPEARLSNPSRPAPGRRRRVDSEDPG
jgi:hypothetical protein